MTKQTGKKILSLALAAALALGLFPAVPSAPIKAQAAMPTNILGTPHDGVDFDVLSAPGNHIYYGAYDHIITIPGEKEGTKTPILWRVMGEEEIGGAGDDCITLMSEYVLDNKQFKSFTDSGSNYYYSSEIYNFLKGAFMNSFSVAEEDKIFPTDVVTGMYANNTDTETTGSYTSLNPGYYTYTYPLPWSVTGNKVYLPWGKYYDNTVYWGAQNIADPSVRLTSNSTTLKNGTYVNWWLRSPNSIFSNYSNAVGIYNDVSYFSVGDSYGVRPAFKLNPSSVIFASEIKTGGEATKGETAADVANYSAAAGVGAKNFKLTVVDSSLSAGTLTADTQNVNVSSHPAIPVTLGGTVDVAAASATASTNLTYKIVTDNGGTREIVGYGQGADNTSLTVKAKNLAGADLAVGSYTVYIWAQKNEAINSNTGSTPQYFTMTVEPDTTPPTVLSVTPAANADNVALSGDIEITFSEAMDTTTTGEVSLDNGIGTLTGNATWNTPANTIYTIPYSGLAYSTTYTINISGFQDVAGNTMEPITGHTFETQAAPDDTPPTVISVTPAAGATDVDIDGNIEIEFSEAMDTTTTGEVSLDNGIGTLTGNATWNTPTNTVYSIPYSGLAYSATYTISISGFQDVAGNTMTPITGHTFETRAAPDITAPAIVSVSPSGADAELGGSVTVTFNKTMNTLVGSVSLSGGGTVGSPGVWSTTTHTNDTYTVTYFAPGWNTQYTFTIAGFKDLAGNAIDPDPDTSHTFTTKPHPPVPEVSPMTLDLDLYGNNTGWLMVYLGPGGNRAAQADITVDPANSGDISVDTASLNADGTVTVTGLQIVSGAVITVEFSDGDLVSPEVISVTVNVRDSKPVPHNITLHQATGGTATASHATATVGEIISLDISSLDSGYSFVRWDVSPAVVWTNGGAASPGAKFAMPDKDVEVSPVYLYVDPATGKGTYSGGGFRYSGGDYSDAPYQPLPPLVKTDPPVWAQMTLEGEPDGNGVLSCVITEDMVRQALAKARENAASEGRENPNLSLAFLFGAAGEFNSLNITFSAGALALLESEGVAEATFTTNVFRFGLDLAAIKEMRAQSGGWAVRFSAARAANPSEDAAPALGGRPVWNVKLGYAYGSKTALILNLGAGTMTLGMPCTLASGEKAAGLAMTRSYGGKTQTPEGSGYKSGWLNSNWSGPGVYAVNYATPAPALADQ